MDFRRRIYALKGRIQPESLNKTESVRFIVRFWIYKWLEQCLFFSFPRGLVGEKLKTCKLFVFLKLPFCSNHSRRNPWKNRKHKDHFQQRLKLRVIKSFYENFRKSLKATIDDKVWGKVVHREIKLQFWKSMRWPERFLSLVKLWLNIQGFAAIPTRRRGLRCPACLFSHLTDSLQSFPEMPNLTDCWRIVGQKFRTKCDMWLCGFV